MKLTLQEKRKLGHALRPSELSLISGWSVPVIKGMELPWVKRKCFEADFWACIDRMKAGPLTMEHLLRAYKALTEAPEAPVLVPRQPSAGDTLDAPHNSNGHSGALRTLAGLPPRNT